MSKETSDCLHGAIFVVSCWVSVLCSMTLAPSFFSQSAATGALAGSKHDCRHGCKLSNDDPNAFDLSQLHQPVGPVGRR